MSANEAAVVVQYINHVLLPGMNKIDEYANEQAKAYWYALCQLERVVNTLNPENEPSKKLQTDVKNIISSIKQQSEKVKGLDNTSTEAVRYSRRNALAEIVFPELRTRTWNILYESGLLKFGGRQGIKLEDLEKTKMDEE